jgi:Cu/Ag efflux protein CusF
MKNPGSWKTVLFVAAAFCLATVAMAQTPAKPTAPPKGKAVVGTAQVSAIVAQIDQKTRHVTLKAEDGQEYSFVAGNEVKNLAQVMKGDKVTVTYTEALAYEVKKGGTAEAGTTDAASVAPLGAKPAGVVARETKVTVTIAAIDPNVPSVTFKGPEGNTRTIKVKDPSKLQGVNVGDTVELTYIEAVGIKVEKN